MHVSLMLPLLKIATMCLISGAFLALLCLKGVCVFFHVNSSSAETSCSSLTAPDPCRSTSTQSETTLLGSVI